MGFDEVGDGLGVHVFEAQAGRPVVDAREGESYAFVGIQFAFAVRVDVLEANPAEFVGAEFEGDDFGGCGGGFAGFVGLGEGAGDGEQDEDDNDGAGH